MGRSIYRKILVWVAVIAAVALLIVLAVRAVDRRYYFFEDRVLLRSSEQIDLRDMELTLEQYELLRAELPGCNIRWMIPISEDHMCDSAAITVNIFSLALQDIPMYLLFDDLQWIYAEQIEDYAALEALQQQLPNCTVVWMVHMGSASFQPDTKELMLNGSGVTAEELLEKLGLFSELSYVEITDITFTDEEQLALMNKYPNIEFVWNVTVSGKTWRNTDTNLSYAGTAVDVDELVAAAERLPLIESIDLSGCGCTIEELLQIREAYGARIISEMKLYGVAFDTSAVELIFNDIPMEDVSAVEAVLPLLPELQKVEMCNCGIPSEEMDALWKRNPQVRFIWSIKIGRITLRTDCTNFTGPKHGYLANGKITDPFQDKSNRLFDEDCKEFKYCVDMVCLDLGHMGVTDYSFIQYMPKLKYLILADTIGSDFSYLKDLKELVFLELFLTDFKDTEVLTTLTSLEDLNIAFTEVDDITFLKQMTWLKQLWISYSNIPYNQCVELRNALPNTKVDFSASHPTGNNWRATKNYFEMRDFLGMYYLK